MSTHAETETAIPEAKGSRVGKLVRWAARLTSIPVLGLVLMSLVPALLSFSVAAKDDRMIALAMCGTCLGLAAGWRWAGLGGGVILLSVIVMLAQGDNWFYPDPYALAFGLQGILFLISAALNSQGAKAATPALRRLKPVAIGLLVLGALAGVVGILHGPGPTPVPHDKLPFVGVWENGAGFQMEITPDGYARISQARDAKSDPTNCPVLPGVTNVFIANFRGDDRLELATGFFGAAKAYRIDRRPHLQGKRVRMILNGSDPYKPGNGMALIKKATP